MARPVADVSIQGYAELRRALAKLEPELVPELRDGMKRAADVAGDKARRLLVADVARRPTKRPRRSNGAAAASIRATSAGNIIYLNAGRASVPYYGWLDFGGDLKPNGGRHNLQHREFLKRGRYLYPAIDATRQDFINEAQRAIASARQKAGFD